MFGFLNLLKNVVIIILVLVAILVIYLYFNQNKLIYMPEGNYFLI
jgi:hypothetical protein